MPALTSAELAGSGALVLDNFTSTTMHLGNSGSGPLTATIFTDTLDVVAPGSGSIALTGDTTKLTLSLAGSASVDASHLPTLGADVHLDGSGRAAIVVSGNSRLAAAGSGSIHAKLDDGDATLAVDGTASIRWSGDAHVVSETRNGSGTIVHE